MTTYTVSSELGLYGVHVYTNLTTAIGVSFVYQAATTFSVQNAPAEAASLTSTQNLAYAILAVAIIAVILDVVLLARKPGPSMPK